MELPPGFGRQAEAGHEGEIGPTGLGVVVEVVDHLGLNGQAQRSNSSNGDSGSNPSRNAPEQGLL